MRGVFVEERMGSKIMLSDLGTGLLSSGNTTGAKMDTAASIPMSSQPSVSQSRRPFHAFKEECSLNEETQSRFKDRF